MMTSRTNNSNDCHPELVQIHNTTSITLSSFSYDGNDLISFVEDETCATELSSRPASATSFLDDELGKDKVSNRPVLPFRELSQETSTDSFQKSIYVMVSGTSFSVPRDAFVQMDKLKWTKDQHGVAHLDTSPAIFEVLLGHIVFHTLPAYDTLSKKEYDEFEPMAVSLGLYDLIEHFDRSSDKRLRTTRGGRRSLLQKKSSSIKGGKGGTPIVLNSENTNITSMKFMAANSKCARFAANSKCARFVASLTRSGKSRELRAKNAHAQLCSVSDHVN